MISYIDINGEKMEVVDKTVFFEKDMELNLENENYKVADIKIRLLKSGNKLEPVQDVYIKKCT